jgi:hypothetical protein
MKKTFCILLAVLFVVSLTAVLSSAHHYDGGPSKTYETSQPTQISTDEVPTYWDGNTPVFATNPHGINTGKIEVLNPSNSLGTPEGS